MKFEDYLWTVSTISNEEKKPIITLKSLLEPVLNVDERVESLRQRVKLFHKDNHQSSTYVLELESSTSIIHTKKFKRTMMIYFRCSRSDASCRISTYKKYTYDSLVDDILKVARICTPDSEHLDDFARELMLTKNK